MTTPTIRHEEIELYSHMRAFHFPLPSGSTLAQLSLEQLADLHSDQHTPNRSLGHHVDDLAVSRVTGGQ